MSRSSAADAAHWQPLPPERGAAVTATLAVALTAPDVAFRAAVPAVLAVKIPGSRHRRREARSGILIRGEPRMVRRVRIERRRENCRYPRLHRRCGPDRR